MGKAVRFLVFRMRLCYLIMAAGFVWYLARHYPYRQHLPTVDSWRVYDFCVFLAIAVPISGIAICTYLVFQYMDSPTGIVETEKSPEGMPITNGDCTDVRKVSDQYKSGGIHYQYRSEGTVIIPHPSYSGLMRIGESNNCHVYLKNGDIDLCEDTDHSAYYVRIGSNIICKITSYTMIKGSIDKSPVVTLEDVMIDNPVVTLEQPPGDSYYENRLDLLREIGELLDEGWPGTTPKEGNPPPPLPDLLTETSPTTLTAEKEAFFGRGSLLAESSPITQRSEQDRPDRGYTRYEIQGQYVTLLPGKSDGVIRTIVESRDCTETYMEDGRICDDIDDDTFYVGEDGGIRQISGYYMMLEGRIIQKGNP